MQRCNLNHLNKSNIYGKARHKDKSEFAVRHYAGVTWYTVTDFLEKNRRGVSREMAALLERTQDLVLDDRLPISIL